MKKHLTGLILEGGAMRGIFTSGVLDVLLEHDVRFDGAAGISAGAAFGCNYKSRQIGRTVRYNKAYCRDPRFCSLRSLIRTGDLYGAEFCYRTIPDELDPFDRETFTENPMAFYVGATDAATGRVVFHRCKDGGERDLLWIRASASMPVVSRPVPVDGRELLDGGIVDPVPYAFLESQGYDRNVIVLTQPEGYRKQKSKLTRLMRPYLRRYPAVWHAMTIRHTVYNRQMEEIAQRERDGTALVIRPGEALGISRTENDPAELERVYRMGRQEGERRYAEVVAFLRGA